MTTTAGTYAQISHVVEGWGDGGERGEIARGGRHSLFCSFQHVFEASEFLFLLMRWNPLLQEKERKRGRGHGEREVHREERRGEEKKVGGRRDTERGKEEER